MSEQRDGGNPRVEQALEALFGAPVPEPVFVAGLEQQLAARGRAMPRTAGPTRARPFWTHRLEPLRRHHWALAAAALLLLLSVALAVVGPRRVLAGIQNLLGYVPGVGFADLEATRLLPAPVEVTRDGVTLRVEQVVAGPDRTQVVIRSEGLPPDEPTSSSREQEMRAFQPVLRLPDGNALSTVKWALRRDGGSLEFPPLPDGVYRVTLELPRLPLLKEGAAPENWQVDLDLQPATGELVADLYVEPYGPTGAGDTHQGITLRVLDVAHSPEETVLGLEVQWSDPDWRFSGIGDIRLPELRDDLGHVYHWGVASSTGSSVAREVIRIPDPEHITPTPEPEMPTYERAVAFAPVSPSARQLTLWVDGMGFHVPVDERFVVDLGDDPQIGDRWPLDVDLTVAGFPLHISGAQLVHEEQELNGETQQRTYLEFDVDPVPDQDARTLHGIGLAGDDVWFDGTTGSYQPQSRTMRTGLKLRDGASIPSGPIEVQVEGAGVAFQGPWVVTWSVPGSGEADAARAVPVIHHPANAIQTREDLTLRVSQVVQTDRLAAVTVELDDPPLGFALNRALSWNSATQSSDLYLADDRGRRYEEAERVAWRPGGEQPELFPGPQISPSLSFEPLNPLAHRATLHVPSLELFITQHLAFDITVPEGVEMRVRDGAPWPVSEPWQVDIPIEVGSYHLQLSQALLAETKYSTSLWLVAASPQRGGSGPQLTGIRAASILAPDGKLLDLERAFLIDDSSLSFDLATETDAVLPGRYHFEVEGATVAVPGPWEVSWDLRER
jgi:hypothetical protein